MRGLRVFPILIATLAAAPAQGENLATFLKAANESATPATAVRAVGDVVTKTIDGTKRDRILVVLRPDGGLYLELREAGTRALVLDRGARAFQARGGKRQKFEKDQAFDTTELTMEDLLPFDAGRYDSPTIVYRDEQQLSVQLNPLRSQYSLVVVTFDPAKHVPIKSLYYKDTLNNLVKMRLDSDHAEVEGCWLPGTVKMQNFPLRTETELSLKWSPAGDLPEGLFDPEKLAAPSGLKWPD